MTATLAGSLTTIPKSFSGTGSGSGGGAGAAEAHIRWRYGGKETVLGLEPAVLFRSLSEKRGLGLLGRSGSESLSDAVGIEVDLVLSVSVDVCDGFLLTRYTVDDSGLKIVMGDERPVSQVELLISAGHRLSPVLWEKLGSF